MINIVNKQMCSGCSACVSKCPVSCIELVYDSEGFLYPIVNKDRCINCGLCDKVCPELHPYGERKPLAVYYAKNKCDSVRANSSSGGIFSIFAEKIIDEGGVVFGAMFDKNWQVKIDYVDTKKYIGLFRGSKYVQARIEKSYIDAECFLKNGKKVLFSGTPCQIAGLNHFLNKHYDNLLTIEVICHGVPSPKVWEKYIGEIVPVDSKFIKNIQFRNKDNGWRNYNLKIDYSLDNKILTKTICYKDSHYMRLFLSNISLRLSCYNCKAKCGRSNCDISIGDFWGIEKCFPDYDDDKGASIVLFNSLNSLNYYDSSMVLFKRVINFNYCSFNGGFSSITKYNNLRNLFFSKLDTGDSLLFISDCILHVSLWDKIKKKMRKIKLCVFDRLHGNE